ncbi:MAG: hypothetical protein ACYS8Y_10985 [Planctomycetota bacterium]
MEWILVILGHLVFVAISGGFGLLVVVVVGSVFEKITVYIRTEPEPSQAQLKKEIEKIENKDLTHELRLLLAERRMCRWWKYFVWLILSGFTYCSILGFFKS